MQSESSIKVMTFVARSCINNVFSNLLAILRGYNSAEDQQIIDPVGSIIAWEDTITNDRKVIAIRELPIYILWLQSPTWSTLLWLFIFTIDL